MDQIGLPAWLSERDIPGGADYTARLEKALTEECQAVVVLLSSAALKSGHVKRELELAISHKLPILPIVVSADALRVDYPLGFGYLLGITNVRQAIADVPAALDIVRSRFQPSDRADAPDVDPDPRAIEVVTERPKRFVGAARAELVRELSEVWQLVRAHRRARLVVLVAESGYGKTRVVQEFYRVLAAAQPQPAFWPADLTCAGMGHRALRESRKRVSPVTLEPQHDACAGYLWLGHVCDEGVGRRVDQGLASWGHELARAIELAAREDPNGPGARMAARALRLSHVADVQTAVLELLRRGSAAPVGQAMPSSVEAFWQGIRAIWEPGSDALPVVVVIEDAHYAGADTVGLINAALSSADIPFLIVACAQESQLVVPNSDRSLGTTLRRPLGQLLDEGLSTIMRQDLLRLDDADIRKLFAEALPELDTAALRAAVVKVDGNPYHAQTLLVEMARAARRGDLDARWIQRRPASFEKELSLQWDDLPELARLGLSAVAVLGTQVPCRLARRALAQAVAGDPQPAESAALATGWLRRSDRMLWFLERSRWVVAQAEARTELRGDTRREVIAEVLTYLQEDAPHDDQLNRKLHLALALAADQEQLPFDRAAAMRSGLAASEWLRLRDDREEAWEVATATDGLVADGVPPGLEKVATLCAVELATSLRNVLPFGATDRLTVAAATNAVTRIRPVADTAPDTAALAYSALARAHRVRLDSSRMALCTNALSQARAYLADARAPSSLVEAEVLAAQAKEAYGRNHFPEAAEAAEHRLALLMSALDLADPRVTDALWEQAAYVARFDNARAVELRTESVKRRVGRWGDDCHPEVARALTELASSLARTDAQDRLSEAYEACLGAVRSLESTRGPAHKHTVGARHVLVDVGCRQADELERTSDIEQAREVWNDSLTRAEFNLRLTQGIAAAQDKTRPRREAVAWCKVRLGDHAGLRPLEESVWVESRAAEPAAPGLSLPALRAVAQLVAAYLRLGQEAKGLELVERHGLVRDERFPRFQPRGWRSTEPRLAKVGVL